MELFPRRAWSRRVVARQKRRFSRFGGMVRLLFAFFAMRVMAAVHGFGRQKYRCEESWNDHDKAKQKFVHSAMQGGCLGCHEIRVNKDVTRVKLVTATPAALCIAVMRIRKLRILRERCIHGRCAIATCHDAHSSDNKNQLVKAESGDEKENLCWAAIRPGCTCPTRPFAAARRHGCDTCQLSIRLARNRRQRISVSI